MAYLNTERHQYMLEEALIGKGQYGSVRKATCLATGSVYACKAVKATGEDVRQPERVSHSFATVLRRSDPVCLTHEPLL